MAEPVLVVHGVANRDRQAFEEQTHRLNQAVGEGWRLIPVFWGNQGAETLGIEDTLPEIGKTMTRFDGGAGPAAGDMELALSILRGSRVGSTRSMWEIVAEAALGRSAVRSAADLPVREAIESEWNDTEFLHALDNEGLLEEIGRSLEIALRETEEPSLVRGPGDVANRVRGILRALDHAVGAVIGTSVGKLNHFLRSELGPGIGRFLGDTFVYEHRRHEFQGIVHQVLNDQAPGWGTEERPVSVIGHSLGGVIAFMAAVEGKPGLWIRHFVTFGSQSAFFQVLEPVKPLPAYRPGKPVGLPPSIGSWTNLWEPLDPIAFLASKVFRLSNGQPPTDIEIPHSASSGLWTHSSYWTATNVADAIRTALAA